MGDFGDAIKYLYEKFILRDVLSFVTPGAIVVLTSLYLLKQEWFYTLGCIHWVFYIPLFGVFFMAGFAIQCFGELIGLVRHTPKDDVSTCRERCQVFNCKTWQNVNWWWKAHTKMKRFYQINSDRKWALIRYERFVVLKQMCANNFIAIIITGGIFTLIELLKFPLWLFLVVWIPLLASLFWGYRVHALKQDDWRNRTTQNG